MRAKNKEVACGKKIPEWREGRREGGRHEDFSVAVVAVAVVSNCSARVSQKH